MRLVSSLAWVAIAGAASAQDTSGCSDCPVGAAITVETIYTGEMWSQVSGGAAEGSRYLDNLDFIVSVDGGQVWGLDGLQLFAYGLYNNGKSIAELAGAAQGVSNIEASRAARLYELWSQWEFGGSGPSVRFGLYDLNSEFDSIETAGLFINPSHGIGPDLSQTGRNGPSIFPVTSLAVRLQQTFGAWSFQAAALDAVPGESEHPRRTAISLSSEEGALLIGEVNYRAESGLRVGGGYWHYTETFEDLQAMSDAGLPLGRNDNAGGYVIVESPTFLSDASERGLNLFLRVGQAEDRVNPIDRYVGAGAVYSGPFAPGRDSIGIAVAMARLGEPFREAQLESGFATDAHEIDYELTYRIGLADWLVLQSDVQYIDNPGMDPQCPSGWTVGLRFEASHSWER